jgi:hypothetical protein
MPVIGQYSVRTVGNDFHRPNREEAGRHRECVKGCNNPGVLRQNSIGGLCLVAAPNEYRLEFENEFVRVSRVRFPARGKVPMHAHPSPGGVLVAVTDQEARLTAPDGSTREVHYKAGQVRWAIPTPQVDGSVQSAHAEENLADKPFELIRIDPKVR